MGVPLCDFGSPACGYACARACSPTQTSPRPLTHPQTRACALGLSAAAAGSAPGAALFFASYESGKTFFNKNISNASLYWKETRRFTPCLLAPADHHCTPLLLQTNSTNLFNKDRSFRTPVSVCVEKRSESPRLYSSSCCTCEHQCTRLVFFMRWTGKKCDSSIDNKTNRMPVRCGYKQSKANARTQTRTQRKKEMYTQVCEQKWETSRLMEHEASH